MRNPISYTVLALALAGGASVANAQQPLPAAPARVVTQPAQTVETVETVRTVAPAHRTARHHAAPGRTVSRVTTTRTIVRDRIVPAPAAAMAPAVAAIAQPGYTEMMPAQAAPPLYDVAMPAPAQAAPLYDVAMPAAAVAAPVAGQPVAVGMPFPAYRYVYESDRILVIDANTNIAVQAIPR